MKIETKQVNITAVFAEDVLSLAQTKVSEIRSKVIELWDESPIVTQFPELVALIIPKEQISVTIQNKAIIIANQNIKPFEERDIEKFLQLVRNVLEILPKPMTAYGYNYHFSSVIEGKEIETTTEESEIETEETQLRNLQNTLNKLEKKLDHIDEDVERK